MQKIFSHFDVQITVRSIWIRSFTNLDASWIKGCVGVLVRRYKDYMFEPRKAFHLTKLVEYAWFEFISSLVGYPELRETLTFPPVLHDPHSRIHDGWLAEHVA
jgi:hypothetical protein